MVESNNKEDIFVLDNKLDNLFGARELKTDNGKFWSYVEELRTMGLNVKVLTDFRKRDSLYQSRANVLILNYGLGLSGGHDSFYLNREKGCTGLIVAKSIRDAEKLSRHYIHIISSLISMEKPFLSDLSWEEMVEKGLIDSYSSREPESFICSLNSILKYLPEEKTNHLFQRK